MTDITVTEDDAVKTYDQPMKAETAEVEALTESIEEKIKCIGVKIVCMKEEISDAEESLLGDKKFLAELKKGCATKQKEWAKICKLRSEELLGLSDTIKILNDDDALELFKKTLPGGASFMQLTKSASSVKAKAPDVLEQAKSGRKGDQERFDVVVLAIRGKKVNFVKVIKMIDNMVALLKQEQLDDDQQEGMLRDAI